jgi:hypothetical protein
MWVDLTNVAEPLMAVVARQSTSGSLTKRLKIDNEAIFREALRSLDSMHVVAIYQPIDPDVLASMQYVISAPSLMTDEPTNAGLRASGNPVYRLVGSSHYRYSRLRIPSWN